MLCPNDQRPLQAIQSDVLSCRVCRGRAFVRDAFPEIYPGVRELLSPDPRSIGRRRSCPRCRVTMQCLRLAGLDVWLDACDACEVLWVEKLDESVIRAMKARWSREAAVSRLAPRDRQELASGLAAGVGDHERDMRPMGRAAEPPSGEDVVDWLFDSLTDLIDF